MKLLEVEGRHVPQCPIAGDVTVRTALFYVALDDMDSLVRDIGQLDIENPEPWTPEEDYYVHIDLSSVGCKSGDISKAGRRINKHMVTRGSYDPRRAFNFPEDLDEKINLKQMRKLRGIGEGYYELWKVRKEFSLADFRVMVAELPDNIHVRIVRIMDNEHDINDYYSQRH